VFSLVRVSLMGAVWQSDWVRVLSREAYRQRKGRDGGGVASVIALGVHCCSLSLFGWTGILSSLTLITMVIMIKHDSSKL
jgi:hypothetical protein